MKKLKILTMAIAVFALLISPTDLFATKKIVSITLRGGQKNDDGSTTYNRVKADIVTEDYSGWALKCTGKGPNICAVPKNSEEGGIALGGGSDVDREVANDLIGMVNTEIYHNNVNDGSITHKVVMPDGEEIIYLATWSAGAIVNGEQEYNVEISTL